MGVFVTIFHTLKRDVHSSVRLSNEACMIRHNRGRRNKENYRSILVTLARFLAKKKKIGFCNFNDYSTEARELFYILRKTVDFSLEINCFFFRAVNIVLLSVLFSSHPAM